jgi:hypothetical protein
MSRETMHKEFIFDRNVKNFGNPEDAVSPEEAINRIKHFYGFICLQRTSVMEPFEAYRFFPFTKDYSSLNETVHPSEWDNQTAVAKKENGKAENLKDFILNPANWALTLSSLFKDDQFSSIVNTGDNEEITVTITIGCKRKAEAGIQRFHKKAKFGYNDFVYDFNSPR